MAEKIDYRFLVRGGSAAAIAARNEVPLARELVVETDTGRVKFGDGERRFSDLPYRWETPRKCYVNATFDGGESPAEVGSFCDVYVPFGINLRKYTLVGDRSGTATVGIAVASLGDLPPAGSICGDTPPALAAQSSAQDAELLGWATGVPAGSVIRFAILSNNSVQKLTLTLEGVREPD